MSRLHLLPLLCAAPLAFIAGTAWGDTVTFYNTGVANDGSLLVAGAADSHYTLSDNANQGGIAATATAANGAWQQPTATAGWLSPTSSGNTGSNPGYYVYETLLDLTGYDPTTASLSGLIAADNQVYIYLNRTGPALYSGAGFSWFSSFFINSGFVSGVNEIDFVVYNTDGPTGLMVDDAVATVTPEPGSLLLLASGIVMGGFALRKRRFHSGSQLRPS